MSEIKGYFIGCVVTAFDAGVNTADMAKHCGSARSEADFERALHMGLERRRADRQADELAEQVGRLADEMGHNV